jgi:hypothetical protein
MKKKIKYGYRFAEVLVYKDRESGNWTIVVSYDCMSIYVKEYEGLTDEEVKLRITDAERDAVKYLEQLGYKHNQSAKQFLLELGYSDD